MTVERSSGFRRTGPSGRPRTGGTSSYSAILAEVKSAGLLRRRYGFYWTLFAVLVLATAGCWVAFAFLGDSWLQLLVAAALGVLFTQFAFLSHEARIGRCSSPVRGTTGRAVSSEPSWSD